MPDLFGDSSRGAGLQIERLSQAVVRSAASAWVGARSFGRTPRPGSLRGRRCHCDPELPIHLVHSEGLREACDFVVDFGSNVRSPERRTWPVASLCEEAGRLNAGATVHVKTDRLAEFVASVLPAIRGPVVLVTGDSDRSPVRAYAALLEDRRIAHWFAQNCDLPGRHPRLTRIPIGLDNPVFTKLEKRLGFALTMLLGRSPLDPSFSRNDMGDQAVLQEIRRALPPTAGRPARALCTFHQNQKLITPDLAALPSRAEAYRELAGNPCCHFVPRRLLQRECWALHGQFAFEVSPPGNGLDCFRTWEALCLGTIPIVMRSTLDPLYEDGDFPVVVVDSWREITADNLAGWRAGLQNRFGAALDGRLSLAYWVEMIRRAAQAARGGGTSF